MGQGSDVGALGGARGSGRWGTAWNRRGGSGVELEKQLLEDWWQLAGNPKGAGAAGWGRESRGVARGPCSGGSSATEENLWAEPRDAGMGGSLRPWQEALGLHGPVAWALSLHPPPPAPTLPSQSPWKMRTDSVTPGDRQSRSLPRDTPLALQSLGLTDTAGCGHRFFRLWGSEAPRRSGVEKSLPARAPSLVHSCPPHCPGKRPWGNGQGSPSARSLEGLFLLSLQFPPTPAPNLGVSWIRVGLPIPCDLSLLTWVLGSCARGLASDLEIEIGKDPVGSLVA